MNHYKRQDLIIDYYFDELTTAEKEQFENHLFGCRECAQHLEMLSETAPLIKKHRRFLPEKNLLLNYHQNLKQQFIKSEKISVKIRRLFHNLFIQPSIPLRLAEATALIIFGIIIGRLTFFKPSVTPDLSPGQNYEFVQASQGLLNNYLQETEMILLDVTNLNPLEDENILINLKQIATYRSLLQKTLFCRERASELKDEELIKLINEIEPILLDLCNMEKETLSETVAEIKEQMKSSHLLFELKTINQEKI